MTIRKILDHSDFATVPMGIIVTAWHCTPHFDAVIGLIAGFVLWTLVEYAVHRLLHDRRWPRLRAFHMKHHQHPHDDTGGTFYSTSLIAVLVGVALLFPVAASGICGFFVGYLAFIVLHHAMHGDDIDWSILQPLADNHVAHHQWARDNMFGVTTSLWDRLFGTFMRK